MYEEFYGFTEKPFLIVPDPDYLYPSPNHEEALNLIEYGIMENVGLILLSGAIGSGKTTLVNYILRQIDLDIAVATIFNTNLTADQLISLIVQEFDLEPHDTDKAKNIKILNDFLIDRYSQNKRTLIVIDEAQNLPLDALEEIRMLTNLQKDNWSLLQVMLVGQPELRKRLRDHRYAQISQRIAVNYHLSALNKAETSNYISHRLRVAEGRADIFTPDARSLIFRASAGIPRSINLVCDSALIYGVADGLATINADTVKRALRELNIMGLLRSPTKVKKATSSRSPDGGAGDDIAKRLQMIEAGMKVLQKQNKLLAHYINEKQLKFNQKLLARFKELILVERKRSENLLEEFNRLRLEVKALLNGLDAAGIESSELQQTNHAAEVDNKQEATGGGISGVIDLRASSSKTAKP